MPPTYRQRVTITRILGKGQRLYDPDNLQGGTAKALIDALTDLGMWLDDAPGLLDRVYRQDSTQRHNGPAVHVLIEEAP